MPLATFFQWRIKPGQHAAFQAAWTDITLYLRTQGSCGSALFAGPDDTFCAVARWPDRQTRETAFAADGDLPATAVMHAAIAETVQRFDMDEVANFWTVAER